MGRSQRHVRFERHVDSADDNFFPAKPRNLTLPTITGTATVGQTLTSVLGTWSADAKRFERRWLRDGVAIAGATAATYELVSADAETDITVEVKAFNSENFTVAVTAATSIPAE